MTGLLDRDLDVRWLDAALRVAREGLELADARDTLATELADEPLGAAAMKKTLTALTAVWLRPASSRNEITDWALRHSASAPDWRPLHFGALLVSQPSFRVLLHACGRELVAAGGVDTVAVRRRMRAAFGPRRTVDIATQRGIKTLRSLAVLAGDPSSSHSARGHLSATDPELAAWLVRCLLDSRQAESMSVDDVIHAPEFFALKLPKTFPRQAVGLRRHSEGIGRVVLVLDQ
ncbi:hypothetical protein [Cellulomonas chengniuliangii]|uniref:DUF222 domain-containing protein n=1 Tax=Cellulomonas chengniuliangii TaxID=2968084 RepID=A0ABY5L0N3_9CELL|nr:hypothetical protein [Cellulomonas chengniuliangii]MCC2309167.1 hypothetical protein [Cellulomonas chengniuliangii]UUI75251.1 hypothetical protein NP064_16050 [Cellulomonas chengniuliangii]